MTMLRVVGLSILIASAAAMLVWFGWGLIGNLRAMRQPGENPENPDERAPTTADTRA